MNYRFWGCIAVVFLMLHTNGKLLGQSNISQFEYFINTDPGFGKATPVSVTAAASINNLSVPVNINALPAGIHRVSFRSKTASGAWSITNYAIFYKSTLTSSPVSKAEYFFNTDPGFGKGTNISLTPGNSVTDLMVNLNVQQLPMGINQLYLRTMNNLGAWSITNKFMFLKNQQGDAISQVEYFYDTDPGFGNGIPVAINTINTLSNYLVPVNVTGLSQGQHTMYLRTKGTTGWSLTNTKTFDVTTAVAAPLINVNSVTSKVNCAWGSFRISFHATGTYTSGNRFTVQLSDKDGSFANPIIIGDTLTTKSSEVFCVLPRNLQDGTNYRIRVVSSTQPVTGISGIDAITIRDRPNLGADTTAHIVCQGETINLVPLYNTTGYTSVNWNTNNLTTAPVGQYRLIVANIYGCSDTAFATVQQDVNRWTGAINSNWHVAGNWSTGKIPYEKTHVVIDGTATNPCEIKDTDGAAASVQLMSGANITLLNNRLLQIQARCNPLPVSQ
jgi:hypothetical protein